METARRTLIAVVGFALALFLGVIPANAIPVNTIPINTAALNTAALNTAAQAAVHTRSLEDKAAGVLFIGMSGVTPQNLDLTIPGLESLLQGFAFSALSTRSFSTYTCPWEGWMQLRSSTDVFDEYGRELAKESATRCTPISILSGSGKSAASPPKADSEQPGLARVADFELRRGRSSWPETTLFSADALVLGAGSALAVADSQGRVKNWLPLPDTQALAKAHQTIGLELPPYAAESKTGDTEASEVPSWQSLAQSLLHQPFPPRAADTEAISQAVENLSQDFSQILQSAPGDVVVDLDRSWPGRYPQPRSRVNQVSLTQCLLAAVLQANQRQSQPRPVLIASVADGAPLRSLQFFATNTTTEPFTAASAHTVDYTSANDTSVENLTGSGVLRSTTTRATGLITMTDVRSLIWEARLSLDPSIKMPDSVRKSKISVQAFPAVLEAQNSIRAQQQHAKVALLSNNAWYNGFHLVVFLALGINLILWLRRLSGGVVKTWRGALFLNHWAFAWIGAALLMNLVPWWNLPWTNSGHLASLSAVVLGGIIAGGLVLLAQRFSQPIAVLALITYLVLACDIMLGSPHQRNGFMGSLVLSSRRYYGISNRTYLILIVAGITLLVWVLHRYWGKVQSAAAVAGVGVLTLLVDALPGWGADFGGPPGIIAAFGFLALVSSGRKLRWWHAGVWVLGSLGVMAGIGFLSQRSNSFSHIGSFWENLGRADNLHLISGKIRDVLRSFTAYRDVVIMLILLVLVLVLVLLWGRHLQRKSPHKLRQLKEILADRQSQAVTIAILLGIFIAVPINDSGALMIKEGFYMAVPVFLTLWSNRLSQLSSNPGQPATVLSQQALSQQAASHEAPSQQAASHDAASHEATR